MQGVSTASPHGPEIRAGEMRTQLLLQQALNKQKPRIPDEVLRQQEMKALNNSTSSSDFLPNISQFKRQREALYAGRISLSTDLKAEVWQETV